MNKIEDLLQLKKALEKCKSAKDFFGNDPDHKYRELVKLAHPDRNMGEPLADVVFKELSHLYESLKEKPTVIKSPTRQYELLKLVKAGDVADIYTAENDYVVKISRVEGGHKLLNNEQKVLTAIKQKAIGTTYDKYFPDLVESFLAYDKIQKRINVFKSQPYYTAEEVHEKFPFLDGKHVAWMFNRILVGLGFVHSVGYVHGAILPSHVRFDTKNHGGQITSWGHAVPVGETVSTISSEYKGLYPKEILTKKRVFPCSDVYMAAKTMLYLGGETLPTKIKRFLKSCTLDSVNMRPNKAWDLQEEFRLTLLDVYGRPGFVKLEMEN